MLLACRIYEAISHFTCIFKFYHSSATSQVCYRDDNAILQEETWPIRLTRLTSTIHQVMYSQMVTHPHGGTYQLESLLLVSMYDVLANSYLYNCI